MSAADITAIVTAGATAITVLVSLFSLQVARKADRTTEKSDRHERVPVLVCPSNQWRIFVHNVGKGPASSV
jgi:hypothetical protein